MDRMKTFFIYLLIFVGFYIVSNFLISAYIKTSYYKISSYDIDVKDAIVTIIDAKASKDDGYIEGKISNNTDEEITDKYMKVELFSDNDVSLGEEYVKVEGLYSGIVKDFKVDFTYDNVTHFKVTFINTAEKEQIDNEKPQSIFTFKSNEKADKIINEIEESRKNIL